MMAQSAKDTSDTLLSSFKKYQQNKLLASDAIGEFTSAARTDPSIVQFLASPEGSKTPVGKAYQQYVKGGQPDLEGATMLSQFGRSGLKAKQEESQRAFQEQQTKALTFANQESQAKVGEQDRAKAMLGNFASGNTSPYSNAVASNPFIKQAASMYGATGQLPSNKDLIQYQTTSKAMPSEISLPSGNKAIFSPSTGGFSVLPQTPEQVAAVESAKSDADITAKNSANFLSDITSTAEDSRHTMGTVDRVIDLYGKGATSGFGQPLLTQSKAALNRFGLATNGLENQQQFENELNNLVLERGKAMMKGGGAVSNYERTMVERASANPNLTPQANMQILGVIKNIGQRNVQLDQLRSQLEDQGLSNVEIAKRLRKARDSMPINVDGLIGLSNPSGATSGSPHEDILLKYGVK